MMRIVWGLAAVLFCLTLGGCWSKDVGRSFYPSGKVRTEATVRNGLLDGPATMFYENGAKMSEANYRAGLLDGQSLSFYENGSKKAQPEYKDGTLHGWSWQWQENGAVMSVACFQEGRFVDRKTDQNKEKSCVNE
jgi:antitoxin component YwqK of YwqJK toxin-antitoxin module